MCGYDRSAVEEFDPDMWLVNTAATLDLLVPSTQPSCNPRELRSLQFFREKTVIQLTTSFPDKLWSLKVLQVAQSEPSISHALFALSSYHEGFLRAKDAKKESPFALYEYNMAIKGLLANKSSPSSAHINLISCIIFLCIETLRGKYGSGFHLFMYGRRILEEWQRETRHSDSIESQEVVELLRALFVRLSIQLIHLFDGGDPYLSARSIPDLAVSYGRSNLEFDTLYDARDALTGITVEHLKSKTQDGEGVSYECDRRIDCWSEAFTRFLDRHGHFNDLPIISTERRAIALLMCHRLYCKVMLSPSSSPKFQEPLLWDTNISEFREIVNLVALVLGLDPAEETSWDQQKPIQPQFHMDIGVISVLYSVILACRDPIVRRKAMKLMGYAPRQEGAWNSPLTLIAARRVVELEESGLKTVRSCSDIPGQARIHTVTLQMGQGGARGTVRYRSQTACWEDNITS